VKPSLNADHIIKMSIKLIGHARKEMGRDIVSRAVRIELGSVVRMIC
jgi:hypothetical protein